MLKGKGPKIEPTYTFPHLWFRLSNTLDKFIIITPTFDPLFSLSLEDLIVPKGEFCVLWFFQKPIR